MDPAGLMIVIDRLGRTIAGLEERLAEAVKANEQLRAQASEAEEAAKPVAAPA